MTIKLPALAIALTCMTSTAAAPSPPQRVFISGHSLVDQPFPSQLEAIAASLGTPIRWNRQYVVGSSIRARTRGTRAPADATGWQGYREGYNRGTEGLDVVAELRRPKTVDGPFDTLLITEQHWALHALLLGDTVRHLRHYHDRFIEGNAQGQTWFYEPWISMDDKSDPRRWIAYEREASTLWQCIVTRINASLAAEGRPDRIAALPASMALAALIERTTQVPGVPGLTGDSVRETVDRFVKDTVHLTVAGNYYMALVSYASMAGRDPAGAWAPAEVDRPTAAALQQVAWQVVEANRSTAPTLDACQQHLQHRFIATYAAYMRDAYWMPDVGAARAWMRWAKHRIEWQWRLRASAKDNPLRYDPTTDKSFWFPSP
jgi:hypothetical protein